MDPEEPENPPEDYDVEVVKKQVEAADPYEPRLKEITKDQKIIVGEGSKSESWVVRLMGDKQQYVDPTNPKQMVCYGVVVVRSLLWPGSFTFYNSGRYTSIYVGSGRKYEPLNTYYPVFPPQIMTDPAEYTEQPEPTPLYEEYVEE